MSVKPRCLSSPLTSSRSTSQTSASASFAGTRQDAGRARVGTDLGNTNTTGAGQDRLYSRAPGFLEQLFPKTIKAAEKGSFQASQELGVQLRGYLALI